MNGTCPRVSRSSSSQALSCPLRGAGQWSCRVGFLLEFLRAVACIFAPQVPQMARRDSR